MSTAPAEVVRVLLVDDDEEDFLLVQALFARPGRQGVFVERADTAEYALARLQQEEHALVLVAEQWRRGGRALDVLTKARAAGHAAVWVVISERAGGLTHGEIVQLGADDCLVKSEIDGRSLDRALRYAVQRQRLELARRSSEAALAVAKDQVEESTRLKSQFLANMSHELRTPMNGIIGMTTLLLETPLSAEQRELAQIVQNSADGLLAVINDILDFSTAEAGTLALDSNTFDLREMVEGALGLWREPAADKGVELIVDFPPGVRTGLAGDSRRLRQVLMNLLGNALKFTDRGEVVVRLVPLADWPDALHFRLEVRDTGVGIAARDRSQLFEPFVQLDGSMTRRHGGTGLGLAMSRQIIERMGGQIGVHSTSGEGSTFWITLTLPAAPVEQPDPPLALPAGRSALIVDDNATLGRVLSEQLQALGIEPALAFRADEALELLRGRAAARRPFSAVLIDRHLPDQDALVLADTIRDDPALVGTKMILLSSAGQLPSPGQGNAGNWQAFLVKPVRERQLRETVSRVIRAPAPAGAHLPSFTSVARAVSVPLRLLVVEDNPVNQKVIVRHLERLGHECDIAAHGAEALQMLALQRYDLILMDCQMPQLDGYEATRRIRSGGVAGADARVPIIAVTAHASDDDRQKCYDVGMNDFLPKPIRLDQLQAAVERQRGRAVPPPRPEGAPPVLEPETLAHLDLLQDDESPEFLVQLIEVFLEETPRRLEELRAAHGRGEAAELASVAHTLKGACATFGARELQGLAGKIEEHARGGDLATAEPLLLALPGVFARLAGALKLHQEKLTS